MKAGRLRVAHVLCVLLALTMLLSFGVHVGGAGWVEDEDYRKNTWELTSHTHWKTADQDWWQSYKIKWDNNVANLTQWSFYVSTWGFGEGSSLYDYDMETKVYFMLEGNDSTTVEVKLWYRYERLFGLIKQDANVKLYVNGTFVEEVKSSDIDPKPPKVKVWFFRTGPVLTVQVRTYEDLTENPIGGFDYDVSVGDNWFGEVDLHQKVEAWGWGWIEGVKEQEVIKQNVPGEGTTEEIVKRQKSLIKDLIDFIGDVWKNIKEVMPPPVQGFMATIEDISDAGWTVMYLTYTIVIGVLPLLGVIVGFYFLNAGLGSLDEMSTEPLMEAVNRFYQLFVGFANTVINIAKTIWGFIKFW